MALHRKLMIGKVKKKWGIFNQVFKVIYQGSLPSPGGGMAWKKKY